MYEARRGEWDPVKVCTQTRKEKTTQSPAQKNKRVGVVSMSRLL